MRELVVLSGKGGTGKTSVLGSLAVLAGRSVLADCDVDAADLHLLLHPEVRHREPFFAGHEAEVRGDACTACGLCVSLCRAGAIAIESGACAGVDPLLCEGCGLCVRVCPAGAMEFPARRAGELYLSETRFGPMVHARLEPGGESSGKLVARVRHEARRLAVEHNEEWVLVDGPPGIGCPVIASLTDASAVLAVAEPTPSGRHDLERVLELCRHFGVSVGVCVSKWDLHPDLASEIETLAQANGAAVLGRIPYDLTVTRAQVEGRPVVDLGGPAAVAVTELWASLQDLTTGCTALACGSLNGTHPVRPDSENRKPVEVHMRIAIPLANGRLAQHFGHCAAFALVDVDPNRREILTRRDIPAPEHQPGLLPRWLAEQGAHVILAGGMGSRAQQLFAQQNIQVVVGAPAEAPEELVTAWLAGTLEAGANLCDH